MAELLRITPQDNVAVALTALSSGQNVTVDGIALTTVTGVPAGHKVALFPIKAGEKVIKYGFAIGYAKEDIPVGAHVHVHNLHTGLSGELTYEYHPTYPTIPEIPAATFMGYPRVVDSAHRRLRQRHCPPAGARGAGACRRRRGVCLCLPAPLWLLADGR